MKNLRFLAVVPMLLMACGLAAATPKPISPVITVDELGNGSITYDGETIPLASSFTDDPGPGGLKHVLTYALPFNTFRGDVRLTDDGATLDVLRFNGDHTLLFYSDNLAGFDAPADTAAPPARLYESQVSIPEVGTEDDNGALYTPEVEGPGFLATEAVGEVSLTYHFISDSPASPTPEPSSLALLLSGVLTGGPFVLRRRR